MFEAKRVIAKFRQHASRQKVNLIYRLINPARYCLDLAFLRFGRGRSNKRIAIRPIRVVLISDLGAYTSEEQFHFFSAYRADLRNKLNLISLHLLLKDVLRAPKPILSPFDMIILKMSFRTSPSEALRIVRAIKDASPGKRIIYFDGDDDLCVQWPAILPYVDAYIKKHIFGDKSNYLKRFVGKSNLHDYVHHRYGYSFTAVDFGNRRDGHTLVSESGPVPLEQLSKIRLGFNLALDRYIMEARKDIQRLPSVVEDIDIIFRGSVVPENWSYYLRKDVEPVLRRLEMSYRVVMPEKRVTRDYYYQEMRRSKICVSPFGYGEICWRDFEAMLCDCLLVKPDMSHVETNPDIFRPYKTYVPVKWDFSDLEEKCAYYLTHESERRLIVAEASNVLKEFYTSDELIGSVSKMLGRPSD